MPNTGIDSDTILDYALGFIATGVIILVLAWLFGVLVSPFIEARKEQT